MNIKQLLLFVFALFTGQTIFAANDQLRGKSVYKVAWPHGYDDAFFIMVTNETLFSKIKEEEISETKCHFNAATELLLMTENGDLYIAMNNAIKCANLVVLNENTPYKIITKEQLPDFIKNPLKGMKTYAPNCEDYEVLKKNPENLTLITEQGILFIATKEEIPDNALPLDENTPYVIATEEDLKPLRILETYPGQFCTRNLTEIFNNIKIKQAKKKQDQKDAAEQDKATENKVIRFAKKYKEALILTTGLTALIAKTRKEFKKSVKDKKLSSLEYAQAYAKFIAHKIKTDKTCGTIFGAMTVAELYCLYLRLK